MQWVVNGYLLSLAALFALGGRLSDIFGHRRMCVLGVIIFTAASVLCGLTPKGGTAEAWIVTFRVVQGAGGALMFPAALAIVVRTFPLRERGKALAIFFGIAGGLTAIGPILGGYLTQWTWRAIFWVNVPVAVIALVLTYMAKPENEPVPARIDYRGAVLVAVGIALSIFGLQQSALWGWGNAGTWACIIGGLLVIVVFVWVEMRTASPLMDVTIFRIRAFAVENLVLLIAMAAFIPVFFFASEYAQISLRKTASESGLFLLYFFIGFAVAAQIGGRILDREGAKRAVVMGCAIAAVGFGVWASKVTHLTLSNQIIWIIVAGAGMGMMLGPANTDAINRASSLSYGEATGITQTIRNYGASLGLAVLGHHFAHGATLQADRVAAGAPRPARGAGGRHVSRSPRAGIRLAPFPHYYSLDFAYATQSVLYVMCGIMGFAGVVALFGLERGLQETSPTRARPRRADRMTPHAVNSFFTGVRETARPPTGRPSRPPSPVAGGADGGRPGWSMPSATWCSGTSSWPT